MLPWYSFLGHFLIDVFRIYTAVELDTVFTFSKVIFYYIPKDFSASLNYIACSLAGVVFMRVVLVSWLCAVCINSHFVISWQQIR